MKRKCEWCRQSPAQLAFDQSGQLRVLCHDCFAAVLGVYPQKPRGHLRQIRPFFRPYDESSPWQENAIKVLEG